MATATTKVVKEAVVTPDVRNVVLELTTDEAETLRLMMARVSGDPYSTRRAHASAIADALDSVKVRYTSGEFGGVSFQPASYNNVFGDGFRF